MGVIGNNRAAPGGESAHEADGGTSAMVHHVAVVVAYSLAAFSAAEVAQATVRSRPLTLADWAYGASMFVAIAAVLLWFGWSRTERAASLRRRNARAAHMLELRAEAARRDFDARLSRALEMSDDEDGSLQVVGEACTLAAPGLSVELLLADASDAHLTTAVRSAGSTGHCPVESPWTCPAVRQARTLTFGTSVALDACPKLKCRDAGPLSAVCVPVTVMGRAMGVLHAVADEGPMPGELTTKLEAVAAQAGARIGMLRAMEQSQVQASTDPLTGLLNRRSLEHAVRPLVKRGAPMAVAMGDLDHFKLLNDTFGHDAGDRALRLFADTLRKSLRPDDIVARYGGEEFLVVMPGCGEAAAKGALERVQEELALAVASGVAPAVTVSFGVAASTGQPFEEVVTAADHALLQAKRSGRNRVVQATGGAAEPRDREAAPTEG